MRMQNKVAMYPLHPNHTLSCTNYIVTSKPALAEQPLTGHAAVTLIRRAFKWHQLANKVMLDVSKMVVNYKSDSSVTDENLCSQNAYPVSLLIPAKDI